MKILIFGYIIRGPMGGMTWHHLQYILGLKNLGHEVYYLEDSGDTEYCCYNPETGTNNTDPGYGLRYAYEVFGHYGLEKTWAYYDAHTQIWLGPLKEKAIKICGQADMFLNLSCSNPIRSWSASIPLRVLIDTDPVFTQIRNLTDPERRKLTKHHNAFFTFGENFGLPYCSIPDDGVHWQPTRQPVVAEVWPVTKGPQGGRFTTVMQWESYPPRMYKGQHYGLKGDSFEPYWELPGRTDSLLELSMGGRDAPTKKLREYGWHVSNPLQLSEDPWKYQAYIMTSKGEFSIAKNGYVTTKSGWFSERSTAYMASGRPVIVQDTGFTHHISSGEGILAFRSPEEALVCIEKVAMNYEKHCLAARKMALKHFSAEVVLNSLLDRAWNRNRKYSKSN